MIGQHFVCGFPGTTPDEAFMEAVRTHKIANVILFARNIESKGQVKRLCEEIQALVRKECGSDALIGIDQEGGMVTRLSEGLHQCSLSNGPQCNWGEFLCL